MRTTSLGQSQAKIDTWCSKLTYIWHSAAVYLNRILHSTSNNGKISTHLLKRIERDSHLTFVWRSWPFAMCFQFVVFTKFDLDPEVIISSLHHPIRLGKMHNTELLTEAMSRPEVGSCMNWMRSRANGNSSLTATPYRCCQSAISPIYSFFTSINQCQSKDLFSHIYFCCFGKTSRRNRRSRQWNPPKKVARFLVPMYNAHHWISVSFRAKFCALYTGNYGSIV